MMLIINYWTDGKAPCKRCRTLSQSIRQWGWGDFRLELPDPAPSVFLSDFLSISVSSCTQLIEKPLRITKPWGGGVVLTWIRLGSNSHPVFPTLHYNWEWECKHTLRRRRRRRGRRRRRRRRRWWWCRVKAAQHFSVCGYLKMWVGVCGIWLCVRVTETRSRERKTGWRRGEIERKDTKDTFSCTGDCKNTEGPKAKACLWANGTVQMCEEDSAVCQHSVHIC